MYPQLGQAIAAKQNQSAAENRKSGFADPAEKQRLAERNRSMLTAKTTAARATQRQAGRPLQGIEFIKTTVKIRPIRDTRCTELAARKRSL
jgi:hypothetical protein